MRTQPTPIADFTAARLRKAREEALARTIAGIGAQRPADDVRHYAGGHVWKRYPHEAIVLRVLQRRIFG